MTLFSRKKADRSLAEETALVSADDENSRQQDADKHMISGKKKCQEDSDSDEKYGKSKLSLHGLSSFAERFLVYYNYNYDYDWEVFVCRDRFIQNLAVY